MDRPGATPGDAPALAVLVPRLTISWARDEPARSRVQRAGTMVSADISGFTRLSERLAQHGPAGAEEMTDILNSYFDGVLAAAERLLVAGTDAGETVRCEPALDLDDDALRETGQAVARAAAGSFELGPALATRARTRRGLATAAALGVDTEVGAAADRLVPDAR